MEPTTSLQHQSQFNYPASMKVYGIVVDDRLGSALIKVGLKALSNIEADLLVFLCLAPHDIRTRTDWDELIQQVRFKHGKEAKYEVKILNSAEQLLDASLNMRILRLPEDPVIAIGKMY